MLPARTGSGRSNVSSSVPSAARAARCLRSWTSRSSVIQRRCLHATPTHGRRVAQEATRQASSVHRGRFRFEAGRLVTSRVASCASLRQRRTSRLRLRSRNHRAAGAAPALGPRFDGSGSPGAASARWSGRSFASAPAPAGAARCPLGSGSRPSPRPSQEGSESPSAVSGARPSTARHRTWRASSGVMPRQGQALTGSRWPAWTRCSPRSQVAPSVNEPRPTFGGELVVQHRALLCRSKRR